MKRSTSRSAKRSDPPRVQRPAGRSAGATEARTIAAPQARSGLNGALSVLLIAATLLAYQPVWHAGFIWDDDDYVTQNTTLRDLDGLRRIWFEVGAVPQYYPLVHTVFWLEFHLWGVHPLGYHVVNVLLHALAAILLAVLLLRMRIPGAWLAAFLFALHPIGVESVAWITELKNVLSTVLYLAAALCYWRFAERRDADRADRRQWGWYAAAFATFVAALLSKTVTCSLPAALLLMRWWATGRLRAGDVVPVIPFLLAGAGMGLETAAIEKRFIGAQGGRWSFTLAERCLIAGRAVCFYAAKLVWPSHLTFIYPRWTISTAVWWQWLFPTAVLALFAALWGLRRRLGRGPFGAWAFFVGTLGPALGFINVYPMRYSFVADHFQYLASIGVFAFVAAVIVTSVGTAWGRGALRASAVGGILVLILSILTWRQAEAYADLETLWRRTIANNADCSMAHNNLGNLLIARGDWNEGLAHLRRAVGLEPDNPEARNSLGTALLDRGEVGEAIVQFRSALAIRSSATTDYNLGTALLRQGQIQEAIVRLRAAVEEQPSHALAHNNLGNAYLHEGQVDAAIAEYRAALELRPDLAEAVNNLGSALFQRGDVDAAVGNFQAALRLRPDFADAAKNLRFAAWVLATSPHASVRNGARAIELARQVDQLTGGTNPAVLATLAAAYAEAGRFPDAIGTAHRALQLTPSDTPLFGEVQAQLRLYEENQPVRDPTAEQADKVPPP